MEVLAASQSNVRKEWFQGTADAVRQYMWLFEEAMRDGVEDFLILSGASAQGSRRQGKAAGRGRAGQLRQHSSTGGSRPHVAPCLLQRQHTCSITGSRLCS